MDSRARLFALSSFIRLFIAILYRLGATALFIVLLSSFIAEALPQPYPTGNKKTGQELHPAPFRVLSQAAGSAGRAS
jgi:hypothetical protein